MATGLTESNTVIITFIVWLLLLLSVAVKVIVFNPKSEAVKVVLLIATVDKVQLSVEPLLTIEAVNDAVPTEFK